MSTRRLPLVYVAGPFRGPTPLAVRRNVERARDLGILVAECGGYPIIPHMLTAEFDKLLTDQFWLDGTLALLQRCDGIALTDNWQQSTGAIAEHTWARDQGMPVYFSDDHCVAHSLAIERQRLTAFVDQVRRGLLVTAP